KTKMQQIAKSISGTDTESSLASIQREIDAQVVKQNLEKMVQTNLSNEGLELSFNSGLVFESGKADIRPEFERTVRSTLEILRRNSKKYSFAVEGHTDTTPIVHGSAFATNWELSSARAIAVRQRLEETGIDRQRVRVEG